MKSRRYSKKDKDKILSLAKQNYSDTEIERMTGFGHSTIGKITTEYWNNKMNNKENA